MGVEHVGKALIAVGLAALAVGGLLVLVGRLGGWPRLPGDVVVQRPGLTLYLPLGTSLLLSAALTLGLLLYRLLRR